MRDTRKHSKQEIGKYLDGKISWVKHVAQKCNFSHDRPCHKYACTSAKKDTLMLTEIKGILGKSSKIYDKGYELGYDVGWQAGIKHDRTRCPPPDDDLVDDLIHASFNYHKGVEFKSVTKERIRKLLEGGKK